VSPEELSDSWLLDAEDQWARNYMTDEEEAMDELERLEFLERTAGEESSLVYPVRNKRSDSEES
jgi:hypothetical protein